MLYDEETPQLFELATLLFEPTSQEQETEPFRTFQARFQSFVDQISSYLHSIVKDGFYTHFFLGIFSTLLDTKLSNELNIKSIFYKFEKEGNLKVAVGLGKDRIEKSRFFVFSEKIEKNTDKTSLFTKDDLKEIMWLDNIPDDQKKEFTLIKINKNIRNTQKSNNESTPKIKVNLPKTINIGEKNESVRDVSKFKEITKNLEETSILEDYIDKLYSSIEYEDEYKQEIENSFAEIMRYIKNIFDGLNLFNKSEAEHHGFVAGIFNNFRYRYNARIYLEQFAGRGYADIILLVRGPKREVCSIPILIEVKVGKSGKKDVTVKSALEQAEGYAYGCKLNKVRLATSAAVILCAGLNLDLQDAFKTSMMPISKPTGPLIENIIDTIYDCKEHKFIERKVREKISNFILKEFYSFPPTPEKSEPFYFSGFLLGQIFLSKGPSGTDFDGSIFIPKHDVIKETRQTGQPKPLLLGNNSFQSIAFIPSLDFIIKKDKSQHKIVLMNIYEINKESTQADSFIYSVEGIFTKGKDINVPILDIRDYQKVIELHIKIDLKKYKRYSDLVAKKENISDFLNVHIKIPLVDLKTYKLRNHSYKFNSVSKEIDSVFQLQLMKKFNEVLESQKNQDNDSLELRKTYKELLTKIGKLVYPFRTLIRKESHFQAVLQGIFDYYSDIKLKEGVRALILTEFQTGAGNRIDMMVQIIGSSKDDINQYKEYIPVGLELKYTLEKLSTDQENELKKQLSKYVKGEANKSITDGRIIAFMGVVFCKNASAGNSLISIYEDNETIRRLSIRSSIASTSKKGLASEPSISESTTVLKRNPNKTKQDIAAYPSPESSGGSGSSSKTLPSYDENMLFQIPKNK